MRRVVVLVTSVAALALLGALGAIACGGNDKPPMMPDSVDGADAAAPETPAPAK